MRTRPTEKPLSFVYPFTPKSERTAADLATRNARAALLALAEKYEAAPCYAEGVAGELKRWAETMRIENAAEWLDAAGWEALYNAEADLEEIEKEYLNWRGGEGATAEDLIDTLTPEEHLKFLKAVLVDGGMDPEDALAEVGMDPETVPNIPNASPTVAEYLEGVFSGRDFLCLGLNEDETAPPRWLLLLLRPWVEEEAERLDKLETERAEREEQKARSVPFAIQARNMVNTKSGSAYLRFPAALTDAGAWGREMVEVDGAAFADEPKLEGLRIYQPRAWTVAPGNILPQPTGQLLFPGFALDPETNPDLACFLSVAAGDAVATMKDAGKVCAKLLPLLFALCPLDGTPIQGTYDDLRKLVYPDYKDRRAAEADRVRVGAATAALHSLRLVARMDNNRARVLPLLAGGYYDTYTGDNLEAGAAFSLNPALLDMVTPQKGKGNFFLVNLSRLLSLDAKDPVSIAVALRIYAYWHTCKQRGHWMPDRLRPLDVDALLVTANAVNQRTAETISGQRSETQDLKQLSKARAALVDKTLPKLVDAGIMDPKTLDAVRRPAKGSRGKGWLVTPEPPPDYLEASKKASRLTRRKPKA